METADPRPGPDGVGTEALTHRGEQQHLQSATMNRQLRVGVSGGQSARFGEQQCAVGGVEADRRRRHGRVADGVTESQVVEFAHGMG